MGRWLSPFFLACAAYFLLWIPEEQPSWVSALVKCLPVLCLLLPLRAVGPGGRHSTLLQGALLCSALGDACLIWPGAFLHGERGHTALSEPHGDGPGVQGAYREPRELRSRARPSRSSSRGSASIAAGGCGQPCRGGVVGAWEPHACPGRDRPGRGTGWCSGSSAPAWELSGQC